MSFQRKEKFPVRERNAFELLVDGEAFFTIMLASIARAQRFIFLEQYLVTTGSIGKKFVQALSEAAQRDVKVYCLFDDYGSRGLNQYSRQQLIDAGIQLCIYNPIRFKHWQSALFRDHRKLLLVDNAIGFVGGAGITDEFLGQNKNDSWHDVVLKIQGDVLQDWGQLFQQTWRQYSATSIDDSNAPSTDVRLRQPGQVLVNHPLHQEFNRRLLNTMRQATQHIWITTPYFVPNWKLRRRLKRMASFGVDVRLLLPGDQSDHPWVSQAARRYYTRMLKHHIRIFEYQPRFTHAKIVICDDWVSIGSSNLDRWNQHWNLDANQAIHDPVFAQHAMAIFREDFKQSREIELAIWSQRPWWQRWHEGYAGYLILLLEKLSRYFPKRRSP